MQKTGSEYLMEDFGSRVKKFQKLMRFKIRDILLVSSLYDNYLFEEDGRLYELIREEYQNLNLSHAPEITHVTTGEEAIVLAREENRFDLIITTMHIEDMHVVRFAQKVRDEGLRQPIILLAYDNFERKEIVLNYDASIFERIFIWQGDYRLIIGMIKYVEDKMNVDNDTSVVGVQTIILVEDNVKFYSTYLPIIYTEIFKQSQRLISEGLNITHRFLRMRARPKILLCTNYEEAWTYFEQYKEFVLGVILDINFKKDNVRDPMAGIKLAIEIKKQHEDIPILIQSSSFEYELRAYEIGASFLLKNSPRLLAELRNFMITNFSFGDFVFKNGQGKIVGRADNLKTMMEQIRTVPEDSILFHSERNHFSNWLKARTEFYLASQLRPRKVADYGSIEEMRIHLASTLESYLETRQRGMITEFRKEAFSMKNTFARIGGGSIGGKARGLGFINTLINHYGIREKFDNVDVLVPSALVLATEVFDQFMEENYLLNFALNSEDDEVILQRFLNAPHFPQDVIVKLREFLDIIRVPLAIRSSSLLEDSQFQPFAGVYQTYMIPNNDSDPETRLFELLQCIKGVYASTFTTKAKDYLKATTYRLEEEKMAVIIQRIVGSERNGRFYPEFAGVAKSYNFYPVAPQKATDGIALVGLGLGKTVVDGGNNVRFCPKYPKHLLQFFSTKETIKNAQQTFFALDFKGHLDSSGEKNPDQLVKKYDLSNAEKDGTLNYVGSTYSWENDAIYDGISRDGTRVVTFAPILKHKIFPLPEILVNLLEIGTWGMGTHVEIEFAVNVNVAPGKKKEFAMLQMRPLVLQREAADIRLQDFSADEIICSSNMVLGNGVLDEIYDIIYVDIHGFDRSKSKDTAHDVSIFNKSLLAEKKPYILIGVGRWGSLDPWLGIPVTWDQISGASLIVEAGFKDFHVAPSQGSHFFQNLTSFRVGYFTVNTMEKNGYVDWDWLNSEIPYKELKYAKHLRFNEPIVSKISGSQNLGIIFKPVKNVN